MAAVELLSLNGQEDHQDFRSIDIGPFSAIPGVQCVAVETIPQLRRAPAVSTHDEESSHDLLAREATPLPEQFYEMRVWTSEALEALKEKIAEMAEDEILPLRAFESRTIVMRVDFQKIIVKIPYLEILTLPVSHIPDGFVQMLKEVVNGSYAKGIHFIAPSLRWYQCHSTYYHYLPKEQIDYFQSFAKYCAGQFVDLSYAGKRIAWVTPPEKAIKCLLWVLFTIFCVTFAVCTFGPMIFDSLEDSEVHTLDEYLAERKYKKIALWLGLLSSIGVILTVSILAGAEQIRKKPRYEKLDVVPYEVPQIEAETV